MLLRFLSDNLFNDVVKDTNLNGFRAVPSILNLFEKVVLKLSQIVKPLNLFIRFLCDLALIFVNHHLPYRLSVVSCYNFGPRFDFRRDKEKMSENNNNFCNFQLDNFFFPYFFTSLDYYNFCWNRSKQRALRFVLHHITAM